MDKIAQLTKIASKMHMEKRSFLLKLADDVNDPSKFDESVPPVEENQQSEEDESSPTMSQRTPAMQPGAGGEDFAAVPEEGYGEGEGMGAGPEEMGARAAQAFIGPEVMQMAMEGDPAATELISRTAGQIAGGIATAFAQSQMQQQPMGGGQPGMEQAGMPSQPPQINETTPEDDLANAIAPVPMQVAGQAEAGPNDVAATQQ
jgi:hypothetical protein